MNILNIITRCTRPQNLHKVKESIFKNNSNFDINWYVLFDTSCIRDIDSEILASLNNKNIILKFIKGISGDFGNQMINSCLDEIIEGFIYILDDDNIIHEDLYENIHNAIINNPDKRGFIFNQIVSKKDFTGMDIRIAIPENIKVGGIDMAQFIVRRDIIGDNRFEPMSYYTDGIFINLLYNNNLNDFLFINKELCYYNYIESSKLNSLPRVLVVGSNEFELKSMYYNDYESTDINSKFIEDDGNINQVISEFNPDSIITIGDSYDKFKNLSYHSLDVRSRWLHFNSKDDSKIGNSSYLCANNFILSEYDTNTPLISFFSPIYKTGDKLWRTYESIKNQIYTNWEWVLVDDSNDLITSKIAEEITKLDCRVKLYDFRKKSGGIIGESKYRAASLSMGKYIIEMDHDDYILPDAVKLVVDAFNEYPDAKFVYSDCAEIDENHNSLTYGDNFSFGYGSYSIQNFGGRSYKAINSSNINPKTIRHIVGVPNHLRAWDRVFYHSIGGHNRRLTIADDYELIVRTFLNTKMVRIPKLLYLQFYHGSNTQDITRKDIQRRVRSISEFYNKKINDRFLELGKVDWAYQSNPNNPLITESRFGDDEGYVNYTMNLNKIEYNYSVIDSSPILSM